MRISIPRVGVLIGAANGGSAVQCRRIFVEVLPRGILDVVRDPLQQVAHTGGLVDDARSYESLHDAVIVADPPLAFWWVETEGRKTWRSPMRVIGNESPEFFHGLARRWDEQS